MLYADAAPGEGIHPPTWARSIETLARYAGRVIESLTVHLALAARSHLVQPSQGAAASSSLASEGAR
jgi:hypothetical protein